MCVGLSPSSSNFQIKSFQYLFHFERNFLKWNNHPHPPIPLPFWVGNFAKSCHEKTWSSSIFKQIRDFCWELPRKNMKEAVFNELEHGWTPTFMPRLLVTNGWSIVKCTQPTFPHVQYKRGFWCGSGGGFLLQVSSMKIWKIPWSSRVVGAPACNGLWLC